MLVCFMYKFFKYFFLLLVFFLNPLIAKEPFIATLINIPTNDIQVYKHGNTKFSCLPYGVISIDEIYRKAKEDSICKLSIEKFYRKRKDLKHFTSSTLHIYQSYSLKIKKENRCAVNIAGEKTLSEFLIDEGLAIRKPSFEDKEYSYYFYRSEQNAKDKSKGMWKEKIVKNCMEYIDTSDK